MCMHAHVFRLNTCTYKYTWVSVISQYWVFFLRISSIYIIFEFEIELRTYPEFSDSRDLSVSTFPMIGLHVFTTNASAVCLYEIWGSNSGSWGSVAVVLSTEKSLLPCLVGGGRSALLF